MGLEGFSDREMPLAVGHVTGIRNWYLKMAGTEYFLEGQWLAQWSSGVNEAVCRPAASKVYANTPAHVPAHSAPFTPCGCGFWAYWHPHPSLAHSPLTGIIRGYGHVIVGSRGFRCQKAEILAFTISPWFRWKAGHIARALSDKYNVPWVQSIDELLYSFPLIQPDAEAV